MRGYLKIMSVLSTKFIKCLHITFSRTLVNTDKTEIVTGLSFSIESLLPGLKVSMTLAICLFRKLPNL